MHGGGNGLTGTTTLIFMHESMASQDPGGTVCGGKSDRWSNAIAARHRMPVKTQLS
jgi:hypothetical protein